MSKELIREFNQLVAAHAREIHEVDEAVHAELARRRVMYGGKVARTFLRPGLLTAAQMAQLQRSCAVLIGAVNTLLANAFGGSIEKMGAATGIPAAELELTKVDPGYSLQVAINRMDAFVDGDNLRFLEFNCDSPAGIAYSDELAEVLRNTPFFKEFELRHSVRYLPACDALLAAFQRIHREWAPGRPLVVAIVDWKGVVTSAEFELIQAHFVRHGVPCFIADPREAEYDGTTLSFAGEPVSLVYKRVIVSELLARKDDVQPLLRAYRERAACFANSFRSRLADNKSVLALLSNPEYTHFLSAEEQAVAAATIPWTRRVAEGRTTVGDRTVELAEYVRSHRADLVMKPNSDYGGHNVFIGSETAQGQWEEALGTALAGDYVVQQRLSIPEEDYPVVTADGLTFEPRKVNINPFALGGQYGGCISRLSTQSVINVAAGGGAVPVFVVE